MSSYRGHVAVGFCVYAGALLIVRSATPCVLVHWSELFLFTLLGALFPDIDTKSKGQQLFYALLFLLLLLLITQGYVIVSSILSLCCLFPLLGKHRGIFHDPVFLGSIIFFVFVVLLHYFPCYAARITYDTLFFSCGVASHIVLDRCVRSKSKRF